jgi:MFS family permease
MPVFVWWMSYQERHGRPALIPNGFWLNIAFTSICIMVVLAWAALQCFELFLSIFFQEIQHLSPLQAALRFLPNAIVGCICNICIGLLVHRIRARWLVAIANILCAISPLLLATMDPNWSFWTAVFWASALSPLSADVLFTIANLVIASVFPEEKQALAGAVFNTVAQFGTAVGLAITAVISSAWTKREESMGVSPEDARMAGLRAVWWVCFVSMVIACLVGAVGLRGAGEVGRKSPKCATAGSSTLTLREMHGAEQAV